MTNRFTVLLMAWLAVVVLIACEQQRDPCLQPTTVYLRARSLKALTDTTSADSSLPNPRWTAIDSQVTLVFPRKTAGFSLPLNPNADSARYVVQPDSALSTFDTITFYYNRKLQFLSNACGYTYFFSLKNVKATGYNVDSVRLRNDEVNGNVNTPDHVQIFF